MGSVCPYSDNQLEQCLKEAGQQLASPPSSTTDLLELLDKTEELLTYVGQAPSISMQDALVPSMGALVADGLVKHSEVDVRISVASCLCQVARITVPTPPYMDGIMKAIFQLNVLAFGQLSNMTGYSYHKAVLILESVARVRSCILMLDSECDALVLEMFELFLSQIRVDHPDTVFTNMETIMTIIVEESDEIATGILSLLISHVKKENQNVTPASWKLAEKVLRNCNNTLKSYSGMILKLTNSNPDIYADVVTALSQNAQENSHVATRSTNTNSVHKRDLSTLENENQLNDPPKKWRQDLVGHRIKVWCALDKMFYESVVSSYNPSDLTYKVLYNDGDEELLNLHNEKWMMLDEISPDQQREHAAELPPNRRTPGKRRKLNGERKLESAIK